VVVSCSQRGSESSRLDSAVQLGESLAALGSPLEVLVLDAALGGAALLALRAERLVMMPGSRVGGCAFASLSVTCPDRPEDLLRAAIGQRAGDASALIESLLAEGKPRGLSQGELARLGVVSVSPGAEEATILERIAREARGDRLEVVRGEGQEGGAR
jgi:hypothetical protein